MGLDMYAYSKMANVDEKVRDLMYWRKHPNLHGWMERLYFKRSGPDSPEFNCVEIELKAEDLDALGSAVHGENLPATAGFFFGESRPEDRVDDLKFITEARSELAAGNRVFYNSWW